LQGKHRYYLYSWTFSFRTTGTTRCMGVMWDEIWRAGWGVTLLEPKNCKFFEIWKYKFPVGAYILHYCYKIFSVCVIPWPIIRIRSSDSKIMGV